MLQHDCRAGCGLPSHWYVDAVARANKVPGLRIMTRLAEGREPRMNRQLAVLPNCGDINISRAECHAALGPRHVGCKDPGIIAAMWPLQTEPSIGASSDTSRKRRESRCL